MDKTIYKTPDERLQIAMALDEEADLIKRCTLLSEHIRFVPGDRIAKEHLQTLKKELDEVQIKLKKLR